MQPYPVTGGLHVTPNKLDEAKRHFSGIKNLLLTTTGRDPETSRRQAIQELAAGGLAVIGMLEDLQAWCGRVEQRLHTIEQRVQALEHPQ